MTIHKQRYTNTKEQASNKTQKYSDIQQQCIVSRRSQHSRCMTLTTGSSLHTSCGCEARQRVEQLTRCTHTWVTWTSKNWPFPNSDILIIRSHTYTCAFMCFFHYYKECSGPQTPKTGTYLPHSVSLCLSVCAEGADPHLRRIVTSTAPTSWSASSTSSDFCPCCGWRVHLPVLCMGRPTEGVLKQFHWDENVPSHSVDPVLMIFCRPSLKNGLWPSLIFQVQGVLCLWATRNSLQIKYSDSRPSWMQCTWRIPQLALPLYTYPCFSAPFDPLHEAHANSCRYKDSFL
jgi:hypothetical protein